MEAGITGTITFLWHIDRTEPGTADAQTASMQSYTRNRTHLTTIVKHAQRATSAPTSAPTSAARSLNASLTKEGIERGGAGPNTREYPVNMSTKADYDSNGVAAARAGPAHRVRKHA